MVVAQICLVLLIAVADGDPAIHEDLVPLRSHEKNDDMFLKSHSGGSVQLAGSQAGGDYQQQIHQYASNYMGQFNPQQQIRQYASNHMGQQGNSTYQKFMNKYADRFLSSDASQQSGTQVTDGSQQSGSQAVGNNQQSLQQNSIGPHSSINNQKMLMQAEQCHNMTELRQWRQQQVDRIKRFVPQGVQHFPLDSIQKQYEKQSDRLQHRAAAVDRASSSLVLQQADQCGNTAELHKWHEVQDARLTKQVPIEYQHFVKDVIEEKFAQQLARLGDFTEARVVDEKLHQASDMQLVLMEADECHTERELREWRDLHKMRIENYMAQDYRHFAEFAIDEKYEERLAQLPHTSDRVGQVTKDFDRSQEAHAAVPTHEQASESDVTLLDTNPFPTKAEIGEQPEAETARMPKIVPKEYQPFVKDVIDKWSGELHASTEQTPDTSTNSIGKSQHSIVADSHQTSTVHSDTAADITSESQQISVQHHSLASLLFIMVSALVVGLFANFAVSVIRKVRLQVSTQRYTEIDMDFRYLDA